ncbi:MAG: hypothetical protein ACKO6L_07325, partial [Flavobacteriales bacterium]
SAQHTLTLTNPSSFDQFVDGKIISTFTLDQELNSEELASFQSWSQANATLIPIVKNNLTITITTNPDYHNRNVYEKLFMKMGVSMIQEQVGGSLATWSIEDFFAAHQL